jgi:hypothetical protein
MIYMLSEKIFSSRQKALCSRGRLRIVTRPAKAREHFTPSRGVFYQMFCILTWAARLPPRGAPVELERDFLRQRGEKRVLREGEIEAVHSALLSPMISCVFF